MRSKETVLNLSIREDQELELMQRREQAKSGD